MSEPAPAPAEIQETGPPTGAIDAPFDITGAADDGSISQSQGLVELHKLDLDSIMDDDGSAPAAQKQVAAEPKKDPAEQQDPVEGEPKQDAAEGEPKQDAPEGEVEEEAAGEEHKLGDDVEITIAATDGEAVKVTMKELVGAFNQTREEGQVSSNLGIQAVSIGDSIKEYDITKIDGYADYETGEREMTSRLGDITNEARAIMNRKEALVKANSEEELDIETMTRNLANIQQLDYKLQPLNEEYSRLESQRTNNTNAQADRVSKYVEDCLAPVWPAYADVSTREAAIAGLGKEVETAYGVRKENVIRVLRSDPQSAALVLDAMTLRKMVSGSSGVGRKLSKATKKSGKPTFLYAGASKLTGKASPQGKKTSEGEAFGYKNMSNAQKEMVRTGDLSNLAETIADDIAPVLDLNPH